MKLKKYWPSWQMSRQLRASSVAEPLAMPLPLMVSLTTIPSRLHNVDLVIRSLLLQSQPPELIVLWLHDALLAAVPNSLRALESERFQILGSPFTCSHRKLIHAIEYFPERTVVTCDDDLMYPRDWLARLYSAHCAHPKSVVAHECRQITEDPSGQLLPYQQWPARRGLDATHADWLAIGYGGVLYPPKVLDSRVTQSNLFLSLAPKADDLWFKMMLMLRGTPVFCSAQPNPRPMPIIGMQKESLLKTNLRQDGNREQWQALLDYFAKEITTIRS